MLLNLDALTLDKGAHSTFESGACLLEAASYMRRVEANRLRNARNS